MSYQFDPRPEGLHYEFRRVAMLRKPIWYLRDGAPHIWIDLRALMEALGISYLKWQNAFRAQRFAWKLAACIDRVKRETLLCPDQNVGQVLALLVRGLGLHASAGKLQSLVAVWPAVRRSLNDAHREAPARSLAAPKPAVRARKVNAFCVRQVFNLLAAGHKKSVIAEALRISVVSLNKVAAGSYDLDPAGWEAWRETFGASSASGAVALRINKVKEVADVPSHVQPDLEASEARLADVAKTA